MHRFLSLLYTDSTLTITTLTQLLNKVECWDIFHSWLRIPTSKYRAMMHHLPNDAERVGALCEWFLSNYPAPSWNVVAQALYDSKQHALLDVVRRHYLKGQFHGSLYQIQLWLSKTCQYFYVFYHLHFSEIRAIRFYKNIKVESQLSNYIQASYFFHVKLLWSC